MSFRNIYEQNGLSIPGQEPLRDRKIVTIQTLIQIIKMRAISDGRIAPIETITRNAPPEDPKLDLESDVLPDALVRVTFYPKKSTNLATLVDIDVYRASQLRALEAQGKPISKALAKTVRTNELVSDADSLMQLVAPNLPSWPEYNRDLQRNQ